MFRNNYNEIEELDDGSNFQECLSRKLYPIGHYMNDRKQMLEEIFYEIRDDLDILLTDDMKHRTLQEIKGDCLKVLMEWSNEKIRSIMAGEYRKSSSPFSSEDNVHEKRTEEPKPKPLKRLKSLPRREPPPVVESSDEEMESAKQEKPRRRHRGKKKSKNVARCSSSIIENSDADSSTDNNKGEDEMLELEMRARAIKSLLKRTPADGEETSSEVYEVEIEPKREIEKMAEEMALDEKEFERMVNSGIRLKMKINEKPATMADLPVSACELKTPSNRKKNTVNNLLRHAKGGWRNPSLRHVANFSVGISSEEKSEEHKKKSNTDSRYRHEDVVFVASAPPSIEKVENEAVSTSANLHGEKLPSWHDLWLKRNSARKLVITNRLLNKTKERILSTKNVKSNILETEKLEEIDFNNAEEGSVDQLNLLKSLQKIETNSVTNKSEEADKFEKIIMVGHNSEENIIPEVAENVVKDDEQQAAHGITKFEEAVSAKDYIAPDRTDALNDAALEVATPDRTDASDGVGLDGTVASGDPILENATLDSTDALGDAALKEQMLRMDVA